MPGRRGRPCRTPRTPRTAGGRSATSLSSIITSVPITMAFMAMNVIENACRIASTGIRRPNTTVSGTPRASDGDEQEQHDHRRHLDAAAGRGRAGADEHQHHLRQPGLLVHLRVVEAVEPGRARRDRLEHARQELVDRRRTARAWPGCPTRTRAPRPSRRPAARRCRPASSWCGRTGAAASRSRCSYSSSQTGNPSPPADDQRHHDEVDGQSCTNGERFVGSSPKPALLKADTRVEQAVPERLPGRVVVRAVQPEREDRPCRSPRT